jgi:hypothetical protein
MHADTDMDTGADIDRNTDADIKAGTDTDSDFLMQTLILR